MIAAWSVGARWLRWDPHLHTPGTLRNDQFADDWDGWVAAIEGADPRPVALGITDYFSLRGYKRALALQREGRLAGILLFPNVELRLSSGTRKHAVNLHLLISPDGEDHVERTESVLSRLEYRHKGESFQCTEVDLKRLGRAHTGKQLPDDVALSEGVNQFKVEWNDLRRLRDDHAWVQQNVLFAVAGGEDGLSGLAKDAAFAAERENLASFADLVFSANERDRRFYGGDHPDFASTGDRPKPCLHGSDAHELKRVLNPDQQRRCWVRAEPTFDGLRQTLVEPLRRVHIGAEPPGGPPAANVIRAVRLSGAPWMKTEAVGLNDGLVTVIGAKGAGKTALADLIAFGAHADDVDPGSASFVGKAKKLLNGVTVELEWGDGAKTVATWPRKGDRPAARVRYLSQQFVERLCSAAGVTEPLIEEIEAVVFSAIPDERRMQCASFAGLRELQMRSLVARRKALEDQVREHTIACALAREEHQQVAMFAAQVAEAERARRVLEQQIADLPGADAQLVERHRAVVERLNARKEAMAAEERKEMLLGNLGSELAQAAAAFERTWTGWQRTFATLGLSPEQWDALRLRVDPRAEETLAAARADLQGRRSEDGLEELLAEERELQEALGADQVNAERRKKLTQDQARTARAEAEIREKHAHAGGAPKREEEANEARLAAYEELFATLVEEQAALERLYAPLAEQLPRDAKLTFYVHRRVDLEAWAAAGEKLLDLRRPPFNRKGALLEVARTELLDAWEAGAPPEVRDALAAFVEEYEDRALDALGTGATSAAFGEWLFSTAHIKVEYGIKYEDVPLPRLSPGTRGVVLLTLYLALDRWDDRPLVIDQPEENLDPKSVYHDLVPFFRAAATRRQIVMVTHNANLVVNTDSDQVLVTRSERTIPTHLPNIEYGSGGLEDTQIRDQVCALLEGGDDAFRRRGRRYGMQT